MVLRNFPFLSNTEMRPTRFGAVTSVWLSATYTSPFPGSVTTSVGSVRASGGLPLTPGFPRVMRILPSGLNLTTTLPLSFSPGNLLRSSGLGARASVTQTFPSRSTWMPGGQTNIAPPKLLISFPDSSNLWTGFALVPRQPGVVPGEHRSVAHTDLPSRSMATPLDPPHGLASIVSWPQSRMTRYGFAPVLTGDTRSV